MDGVWLLTHGKTIFDKMGLQVFCSKTEVAVVGLDRQPADFG